jgi:antitoxin component YwqK of YwqJK toxin-antitoxin module
MKKLIFILPLLFLMACESPIIEKVQETYPDNTTKLIEYFQEIDGQEVLVEKKHFHQNGNLKMTGKFKNGKRDGEWKAFFANNQIQSLGFFKDGLRTGEAKIYYPNGKLRYEGFYEKDKEVGHWKFYTEAGQLTKEKDF